MHYMYNGQEIAEGKYCIIYPYYEGLEDLVPEGWDDEDGTIFVRDSVWMIETWCDELTLEDYIDRRTPNYGDEVVFTKLRDIDKGVTS